MSARKGHPVLWWNAWILLTILTFFLPCWFWTRFLAERVGPMTQSGVPTLWLTAVFGTWMVFLVPLIVVMYNRVDRAYDEARAQREKRAKELLVSRFPVKAVTVEESRRLLPKDLQKKLKRLPKTLKQGQLVSLTFRNGERADNVFVFGGDEIVGIYGRADFPFDARQAVSVELMDPAQSRPVDYERWLRVQ